MIKKTIGSKAIVMTGFKKDLIYIWESACWNCESILKSHSDLPSFHGQEIVNLSYWTKTYPYPVFSNSGENLIQIGTNTGEIVRVISNAGTNSFLNVAICNIEDYK